MNKLFAFFINYNFAKRYENLVKDISLKHEICLHGYAHKDNYYKMSDDEIYAWLSEAKLNIEKIIGRKIIGFRSQRLQKIKISILLKLGFKYDSSLNPTWIPGRYFNFFSKRRIFDKEGIKIVPSSVIPIIRFPFFWMTFRNFNLFFNLILSKLIPKYIVLYMHPWEFVDLKNYKLPFLIKRKTGDDLFNKLENFIIKGKFNVVRTDEFLTKYL